MTVYSYALLFVLDDNIVEVPDVPHLSISSIKWHKI